MTSDLAFLTLAEASALIQSRQSLPVEYVEALIHGPRPLIRSCTPISLQTFDLARHQARSVLNVR